MSRQKSIDHREALLQSYTEKPSRAIDDVLELARQANELEDRVKELEAENADLRNQLRDALERC